VVDVGDDARGAVPALRDRGLEDHRLPILARRAGLVVPEGSLLSMAAGSLVRFPS